MYADGIEMHGICGLFDMAYKNGENMSREQIWELEEIKRTLLKQAYRMKQENPHMSPVGIEYEMYGTIMRELQEITARLQMVAEA